MCRVTILNENGIPVTVEVSREIYQVFVDYEREIERQRKADFRHRDARSWDTCLIFEVSTETLEQTYERIRTLHEIQEALNEFTPKQRRRFLLHFAYGYFDKLYSAMNDVERRRVMETLISEIQIYEDRQPNGQWLKSIKFKLPIIEEDMEISLDNDTHVEAIVSLQREI